MSNSNQQATFCAMVVSNNAHGIAEVITETQQQMRDTHGDETWANQIRAEAYQKIAGLCGFTFN